MDTEHERSVAVVTGASGFLGRRVVAELWDRGWEVRGLDLRAGPGILPCDLTVAGPWVDQLHGAQAVVHTAALVGAHPDDDEYWRANVEATKQVLDAAITAKVDRLVHISSVVVLGDDFPTSATEEFRVRPTGLAYTDTKISAEHLLLNAQARQMVDVVILRPGDVYGPGGTVWTKDALESVRNRRLTLPRDGSGFLSPIYVDDVARAVALAAETPAAKGEIIHVAAAEPVTALEYYAHFARMLGVELASALSPRVDDPGVDEFVRRELTYFSHTGSYSIEKAQRLLTWKPEISLGEGMRRTEAWLIASGLLATRSGTQDQLHPSESGQ